jgi:hypothetical protein
MIALTRSLRANTFANQAYTISNTAATIANSANSLISSVQSNANLAVNLANTANIAATSVNGIAVQALTVANTANVNSTTAYNQATIAYNTASSIDTKATSALNTANTANLNAYYANINAYYANTTAVGIMAYFGSLYLFEQYMARIKWLKNKSALRTIVMCGLIFLVGVGVVMGRVQRTNSWDLFLQPLRTINDLIVVMSRVDTLTYIVLFSALTMVLYYLLKRLAHFKKR